MFGRKKTVAEEKNELTLSYAEIDVDGEHLLILTKYEGDVQVWRKYFQIKKQLTDEDLLAIKNRNNQGDNGDYHSENFKTSL